MSSPNVLFKHSIATQLLSMVFAIYLLITINATGVQMIAEYNNTQDRIVSELQNLETIFQPGLSQSLWSMDINQLNAMLKGIMKIPIIVGVKLEGVSKKQQKASGWIMTEEGEPLLIDVSGKSLPDKPHLFSRLFLHQFKVTYIDENVKEVVGIAVFYSSTTIVLNQIKHSFIFIIVNALIKTIALWVIFLVVSRVLLTRPLSVLIQSAEQINLDNLEHIHINLKNRSRNELKILEEALITMVQKLLIARTDLQKLNQSLEEKIQVRTQQLQQKSEELSQKNEELAKVSRFKSEFLANMSHEIRTPINAVIGFTGLALKTELSPKQYDYIVKIESSATSLLGIINDILDFSKIDAGKLEMEAIDFNLEDVINTVANIVAVKAAEKEIEYIHTIASDVPLSLIGAPLRLRQILINLSNNAVKFTESGHVLVKTELIEKDDQYCQLKFSVSDTGIGMTDEQLTKLFSAFSQLDNFVTRKFGGTGLGLTISKRLVEMMNGEIHVTSEIGKGSTFSFTVRFAYKPLEQVKNDATLIIQSPVISTDMIKNARVLLVEDNELNQQLAIEILMGEGLIVETANNGQEAIDEVNQSEYDIVLMDVHMPVMGGYQASRIIRQNEKFKELPIIAMTAHAISGAREECIDAGMNDYITKPIDISELFSVLMKWIKPGIRELSQDSQNRLEKPKYKDDLIDFPDMLDGIDIQSGLARIKGNKRFFKELLIGFSKKYANITEKIRSQLEQGNLSEAERLIHTVRGIAGNISAIEIFSVASKLEIAVNEKKETDYMELLPDFDKAMRNVLTSLKILEPTYRIMPNNIADHDTFFDRESIKPILLELHHLIKNDSPDALDSFIRFKEHAGNSILIEEINQLDEQINNFDFPKAFHLLEKIAGNMNISFKEE
ncbi:MAG: response regulator [Desulfobacterales bacterium]|nr:response regulator [Desulfobacterales bacterium]